MADPETTTPPEESAADLFVDGKAPAAVPYERFLRLTEARRAERTRAEELTTKHQTLEAELTTERQRLAALQAERDDYAERLQLHRVGLPDDDAVVVARALYARQPADGRPPSLSEWLTGLRQQPDAMPPALRPYLAPPAPAAPAPAGPGGVPKVLPPPQHSAPPSTDITAEQLRAAREEAQRTGDWTAFNALAARLQKRS